MLCGAGMLRVQLERRSQACGWCGREESNFHGVTPTAPSTLRVYQFRHDRAICPTHGTHVQLDERIGTRAVDQACSLWQAWDGGKAMLRRLPKQLVSGPEAAKIGRQDRFDAGRLNT